MCKIIEFKELIIGILKTSKTGKRASLSLRYRRKRGPKEEITRSGKLRSKKDLWNWQTIQAS
jgi:hypothetical protein